MTTTTLHITRGLPGSGKTTFAKQWVAEDPANRARVNRDDLRLNLYGLQHGLTFEQESRITAVQHSAVRALLKHGTSVIVDDTNLRLKFAKNYADIAVQTGAVFEVHDFDTSVDTCIERDAARDRTVGADVIRGMAMRFPHPWAKVTPRPREAAAAPAHYEPRPDLPSAWLIDVDGTLAHMGDRSPYDITRVSEDTPVDVIIGVVHALAETGARLVVMSGRSEECRTDTETWLTKHLGPYDELWMRAAGDNRPDYLIKSELFDAHVRDRWNVVGVLDDRNQVVRMWRSMGLTCLQVADGNF